MRPAQAEDPLTSVGIVTFYNDMMRFGFVRPDKDGTDMFVPATALGRAGMRSLVEGRMVSFEAAKDRRSGEIALDTIETA